MDDLIFREATAEDEDAILTLARESLGWGDDDRYRQLFRWKHDENPFGPSPRWVATAGDRVVGFRTMMRWGFHHPRHGSASAVRAVDTATASDHRGRGIFRELTLMAVEELRERRVDFVFNTPNDQSRPGYLKMGWVELGRPPVAVTPRVRSLPRTVRSRVAADLWSIPTEVGEDPREFFRDPSSKWSGLWRPRTGGWEVERSRSWCLWRFGFEPLHYRVLTTDHFDYGGPVPGAVVFRLRRRGDAIEAVVSLMAARGSARRFLLRRLRRFADHVIAPGEARFDLTPSIAMEAFGPLVTWRSLHRDEPIALDDISFQVGDLELF